MPTFDGGHYFLTVLVPVKTDPIADGPAFTSPVHALRKRLAMLAPAQQTPACCDGQSPFARNTRNHFARFVIIDDVAYPGRITENSLRLGLGNLFRKTKINLVASQPQDHLACPFLLFAVDFDAASGDDVERNSYLATLWNTMETELREIFTHCERFDDVNDPVSFAKYIASCQLETTMPFNDYYVDPLNLPTWPADKYKYFIAAAAGLALLALGFIVWFFSAVPSLILALLGAATLGVVIWRAYTSVMAAGATPFPPAPDSTLPAVLKGLHLQRTFTRFAIENQLRAVDPASADELHAAFGKYVDTNEPGNLGVSEDSPNTPDPNYSQTQKPGNIGI
jgi:hypothetical protein